jgi:hypothetical protein
MADDAPKTPEQVSAEDARRAAIRAKRMANLLPPVAPGEVRNPGGKNGREQRDKLIRWLEQPSTDDTMTRIERVWQATYLAALKGSAPDRKTLIEQHGGKPRSQLDLSNDDESLLPAILRVLAAPPPAEPTPSTQDEPKDDVG